MLDDNDYGTARNPLPYIFILNTNMNFTFQRNKTINKKKT